MAQFDTTVKNASPVSATLVACGACAAISLAAAALVQPLMLVPLTAFMVLGTSTHILAKRLCREMADIKP